MRISKNINSNLITLHMNGYKHFSVVIFNLM